MKISINKTSKVRDVKKQFAALFPFLKLEFFMHRHGVGESSFLEQQLSDNSRFPGQLQAVTEGEFIFTPNTSVSEFEQRLQNEHGVSVQVFRKSGDVWLETVQTDNLSLGRQNEMGKEASITMQFNINTLFL